jgi:hypothetical protein
MNHRSQLAGAAVGALAWTSLVGLVPVAQADAPDTGAARNDIGNYTPPAPDTGAARNDIGNYVPPAPDTPAPIVDTGGVDAGDIALGSIAGLVVVGAAGTAYAVRRRHLVAQHPA